MTTKIAKTYPLVNIHADEIGKAVLDVRKTFGFTFENTNGLISGQFRPSRIERQLDGTVIFTGHHMFPVFERPNERVPEEGEIIWSETDQEKCTVTFYD
jgi:hypothetical protein